MNIKEFFGKAAAGIYVSGLSVIVLVVALIGYIMYGLEKNNLEALIVVQKTQQLISRVSVSDLQN